MTTISVVIPAFNEERSIGLVLNDIPHDLVNEVVVVDNNSFDETARIAEQAGATVLHETKQGYGAACLKGIAYFKKIDPRPDILVFLDADHSDHPQEMSSIVAPILNKSMDLVIGSRALGTREEGAMLPQQLLGNWLATRLLKWIYGANYTDLGPFRAIRFGKLMELGMKDTDFGWTIEMQLKAVKSNLRYCEVPVSYRKRIGYSKISGTVKGTILAGYKILYTLFKYR